MGFFRQEYSGILLNHKKGEMMPSAATWMDLEIIILSEVRQRKTDAIWHHLHVESKTQNELIYETNRLTDTENRFMVATEEGR